MRIAERLRGHGIDALLTTNTRANSRRREGRRAGARAMPLSITRSSWAASSTRRGHPALVVVETEIWPAMLRSARARRIPRVLAGNELSERALGRYRLVAPLLRETRSAKLRRAAGAIR
ncbi:MAG: glycosyltransferase N-terminal domain-containing protein [Acidobacteriota bacterium]